MASGSVIAGVIGRHKFSYDLWGDTVNTASRMESNGLPGRIQVTAATYDRLRGRYGFEDRGEIEVKGEGPIASVSSDRKAGRPVNAARVWSVAAVAVAVALVLTLAPGTLSAQTAPPVHPAPPVRDVAEILAGEVEIVADPGGTSATVEVSTTMDAACVIVFGEDETLGRLALDANMGAAAHRDHRVVLGGLVPDTGYVFRLQGSGIDGNLYRSRLYSFRTPAAVATAAENVAIGARIVDVSSEYSAAYAATNAVDGDISTEWSSQGDGDDAFITVDLGRVVDVSSVAFRTRQMGDGTATTQTFTVTVDGQVTGPLAAGSTAVPVQLSGQVLRFDVDTSTGGNTGAVEIEVVGTGDTMP